MAEMKFGHREGPGKGKERKVAADQYFHRRGGHFVHVDGAGHVVLATDISIGSPCIGWAEVPKDTAGKNSWKSSSTAGADSVFVITGYEDRFEIPYATGTASACATEIGKGVSFTADSTATHALVQKAKYFATAASAIGIIYDFDKTNQTVLVGLNPAVCGKPKV